jgi:multiple sugar transport system ATP-binding protein
MADLELRNITKTFPRGVAAVSDLSLHAPDGSFTVIVGPSGCGKTTTLRIVAGLDQPTTGSVHIAGRDVTTLSPRDRDVSLVFQDYALYPHMTVRRNLAFALKMRKIARAEIDQRIAAVADQLDFSDLLDRKPSALSGGQQQRAALGRVLVRQASCTLFDEPLSNLDAQLRLQVRAELKAAHARAGGAFLYVTHDQEEAMTLADRLIVMHEGRVRQVGDPLEIHNQPADRFVASFLGSPSMNFIPGRLERIDNRLRFTDGADLSVPIDRLAGDHAGRECALGVRPHQLRLQPSIDHHDAVAMSCAITLTEPLGDRTDLHVEAAGGRRLTARVNAPPPDSADRTMLYLDPADVHLFEPGPDGARIV